MDLKAWHSADARDYGQEFSLRAGRFITAALITTNEDAPRTVSCYGGGEL